MILRQAFKYELRLNGAQCRLAASLAGCRRFVFNRALALQQERYQGGEKYIAYQGMTPWLLDWKKEFSWLSDAHSQVLQQSLKDLHRSFINFFEGRAAYPNFKKKFKNDSFRFPQIKLKHVDSANGRIKLPTFGWVRYRNSRDILGVPKNVTVSRKADKWFISIQTERDVPNPIPTAVSAVGIDMGVANFAALSDGTFVPSIHPLKSKLEKLRKYQRRVSRKKKFSKNWCKAKLKVSRLHQKIGDIRRDFLHKASSTICKNHALVALEDLKITNMSASASGTAEAPGNKVAQKSGLNRAILDQGWGEFRRQLQYKMHWAGGLVELVAPAYTSQTCPQCGHVEKANRVRQNLFVCCNCSHTEHADTVGARNVLKKAQQRLAADADKQSTAGHAGLACVSERCSNAVSNRNSPKRPGGSGQPGAVGILVL